MSGSSEKFSRVDITIFGLELEALLVSDELGWVAHVFTPSSKFKLEDIKKTEDHFSNLVAGIFGFLKEVEDYCHLTIKNVSVAKIKVPVIFELSKDAFFSNGDTRKVFVYKRESKEVVPVELKKDTFGDTMDDPNEWESFDLRVGNLISGKAITAGVIERPNNQSYLAMWEEKIVKEVFVEISIAHKGKAYDIPNPEYIELRDKTMNTFFDEWKKSHPSETDDFKQWKKTEWTGKKEIAFDADCQKNKIEKTIKAHSFEKGINFGDDWTKVFNVQKFDLGFRDDLNLSERRKIQNAYSDNSLNDHPYLALPSEFAEKDKDGKIVSWKFPSLDELVIYAMKRFNGNG